MKLRALPLASIGLVASVFALALVATGQEPATPRKVVKTDAEWRKLLSPTQYAVTRQAATEPAFSGKLLKEHRKGVFECVCCGTALFSSRTKFESGTGWPSFYAPYAQANIETDTDYKLGYARTEVRCSTCGRPPRPRLRRRAASDRPPLLHELRRAQVRHRGGRGQGQEREGREEGRPGAQDRDAHRDPEVTGSPCFSLEAEDADGPIRRGRWRLFVQEIGNDWIREYDHFSDSCFSFSYFMAIGLISLRCCLM